MQGIASICTLVADAGAKLSVEPELIEATGGYLHAHMDRHGHAQTAEAFGVSRHTLRRFLECAQRPPSGVAPADKGTTDPLGDDERGHPRATGCLSGPLR